MRTMLMVAAAILLSVGLAEAKPTTASKPVATKSSRTSTPVSQQATSRATTPDIEVVRYHGRKILRFKKGWVIPGTVQRPLAVYFLERAAVNYGWQTLQKDFTPRILDATRKGAF